MQFPRINLSLKLKVILLFFGLSSTLSVAMVFLWHRTLEESLFRELQSRLANIAYLSGQSVNEDDLRALVRRLEFGVTPERGFAVMDTPEYVRVARRLREIVAHEKDLLLFAYVVWPAEDENQAIVVADNAALSESEKVRGLLREAIDGDERSIDFSGTVIELPGGLRENSAAFQDVFTRAIAAEEVWIHGYRAPIGDFPVMVRALRERTILVEQELYFDAEGEAVGDDATGNWSFSGYAPIFARDGEFLGLMGVDISANQMKASLDQATRTSIVAGVAGVIVSLLISLLVGWYISRRILYLKETVQQFADRRMDVRAEVHSGDEVQELAESFNDMAGQIQQYSQNLESMVKDRTRELKESNQQLLGVNRQIMRELEVARRVQESILPSIDTMQSLSHLKIACHYRAMESIGGDLFDFFKVGHDEYGFFIADVSGHGVAAALITSLAKVSFQTHSSGGVPPAAVCGLVNSEMCQLIGDLRHYLTAFYLVLNVADGTLTFSNAGHPEAILYRARTRECIELDAPGIMLGIMDGESFEQRSVTLEPGDKVLLYTDGITESRGPDNELYGPERLLRLVAENGSLEPEVLLELIREEVGIFTLRGMPDDDRALFCVQYPGPVAASDPS
jgi:serine phosphatase RsbU (regulator of sigma subunit)